MRKVIQLNHTNYARSETLFDQEVIINNLFYSALCDDGTMWFLDTIEEDEDGLSGWQQLPSIPQEENI